MQYILMMPAAYSIAASKPITVWEQLFPLITNVIALFIEFKFECATFSS